MPRSSVLTAGLEELATKGNSAIKRLLQQLYTLDDTLQQAHEQAKRDEDFGEDVVQAYEAFMAKRQELIKELEQQKIAVPWQLRMRIDDVELTLRERKIKQERAAAATSDGGKTRETTPTSSTETSSSSTSTAPIDEKETDPLLPLKALILPTLLVLFVALIVSMSVGEST
ncbi:hypothetical protein Poli38472_000521 [Pythium oligandrum]|uniref:Uncharacterized protein n=1 Tax=Pythium oligandrum TaxID=41045 RepID=A0A8K1FGY3_PYTOL|nr:hypothetical protein Poli38472_000521 [Pythium oligandrum]|eukprot:TMW60479.1 hypothetical protein Poli38472_000521 [Pythium oligandrum]